MPVTEPDGSDRFSYDVAFSFAGEDREYVERVAKAVEGKSGCSTTATSKPTSGERTWTSAR
jgi:hypothetical protein